LRVGYNNITKDLGGTKGLSFGGGITLSKYIFDYAYTQTGDLGNTNRFTLSVKF
jgi:hypothetical protein